jgi:hypothetical protein
MDGYGGGEVRSVRGNRQRGEGERYVQLIVVTAETVEKKMSVDLTRVEMRGD